MLYIVAGICEEFINFKYVVSYMKKARTRINGSQMYDGTVEALNKRLMIIDRQQDEQLMRNEQMAPATRNNYVVLIY